MLSLLWVQLLVMPFISRLLQGQKPQPQRSPRKDLLQSSVIFPPTQHFFLSVGKKQCCQTISSLTEETQDLRCGCNTDMMVMSTAP